MAKKKTLYRTVFTFVTLTPEPFDENTSLTAVDIETMDGQGVIGEIKMKITELTGKSAVNEATKFNVDPEFFFMDERGYPIDEDEN